MVKGFFSALYSNRRCKIHKRTNCYLLKLLQISVKNGTDMDAIRVWQALKKRKDEGSSQQDLSKLITIKNSLCNDLSHAEGLFTSSIEGSSELDEPFQDLNKYV